MKKRSLWLGLSLSLAGAAVATLLAVSPATADSGADLTIHNETGTDVDVYVAEGENAHHGDKGEFKGGHLKNGEHGTAHVKLCKFHVFLVHGADVYHQKFTDCKITDIHIKGDTKGK